MISVSPRRVLLNILQSTLLAPPPAKWNWDWCQCPVSALPAERVDALLKKIDAAVCPEIGKTAKNRASISGILYSKKASTTLKRVVADRMWRRKATAIDLVSSVAASNSGSDTRLPRTGRGSPANLSMSKSVDAAEVTDSGITKENKVDVDFGSGPSRQRKLGSSHAMDVEEEEESREYAESGNGRLRPRVG